MSQCKEMCSDVPFQIQTSPGTDDNKYNISDSLMKVAMKDIFLSCDQDNVGAVPVSQLIGFMTPYMSSHEYELLELKKTLDPLNVDTAVDKETFFKVMSRWCELLEHKTIDDNQGFTIKKSVFNDNTHGPFAHSSPIAINRRNLLECSNESAILNMSDCDASRSFNVTDVGMLHQQINALEHNKRKLTNELELARAQLTESDELNAATEAQLLKISRRLLLQEQLNEQLEKEKSSIDEIAEAFSAAQKQIGKLEKDFASSEKLVCSLKDNVQHLKAENRQQQDKIEVVLKQDEVNQITCAELQADLGVKQEEVLSLEETLVELKSMVKEQETTITYYKDLYDHLKKEKLEQNRMVDSSDSSVSLEYELMQVIENEEKECQKNGTPISCLKRNSFQPTQREDHDLENSLENHNISLPLKLENGKCQTDLKRKCLSFEKLQMKIDKLKNKYDMAEFEFKYEQRINEQLKLEIAQLRNEIKEIREDRDSNLILLETELKKNNIHFQCLKQEKSKIEEEFKKVTGINETNYKTVSNKNEQLKQEIENLAIQKRDLEIKVRQHQNCTNDTNVAEVVKMKFELANKIQQNNQLQDLQYTLHNKINYITKENEKSKVTINKLQKEKIELQEEVETFQRNLQKLEMKRFSIRKDLTDINSNYNDAVKNLESLLQDKSRLQLQCKEYECELVNIKIKLCDSSNHLNLVLNYLKTIQNSLRKQRKKLNRSTADLISTCEVSLLDSAHNVAIETITDNLYEELLDTEMRKIKDQIKSTLFVHKSVGLVKSPLGGVSTYTAEIQGALVSELPQSTSENNEEAYAKYICDSSLNSSHRSVGYSNRYHPYQPDEDDDRTFIKGNKDNVHENVCDEFKKKLNGNDNLNNSNSNATGIRNRIGKVFCICLPLVFIIIAIIFIIGLINCGNEYSLQGYPWRWVSWNDIVNPLITLRYRNGPPPI